MMFLPLLLLAILFAFGVPVAFALIQSCIPYFISDPFLNLQVIV